jgi:hypothetical protein
MAGRSKAKAAPKSLAPRGRNYNAEIRAALRGEAPRYVPFTIYPGMLVRGSFERRMRERGVSICWRVAPFSASSPDVKISYVPDNKDGVNRTRVVYETPVGTLTALSQAGGYGSSRTIEHPVKKLDDYRVAEFMARNTVYEPAYDSYQKAQEQLGTDGYVLSSTCYSPLMHIEVALLGIELFCTEIIDHEAEIMSLYQVLWEKQRDMFRIVAKSPCDVSLYCGNIMQDTLGPKRIEKYIVPCFKEFADVMHEEGKMLGCHLDADNSMLLEPVVRTGLDMIEAFTPPPDCDTSGAAARAAWPGKVLSLNFPSSVHLRDAGSIGKAARQLIAEAGDRRGFIMGITEDVPWEALQRSLPAILDVIEECPLD